jgi:hypothetical protein
MPEAAFKIWENVYNSAKAAGDSDEKAAKKAYGALGNAGWHKDEKTDKWVHKAYLQEFSLRIERAGLDKPTGDLLWRMVASDTDADSYNDSMSLELFQDFLARSNSGELVPEQFRSDFWSGGMPYLSISHYPDLNGDAVPGVVDAIYIDGNYFKAKGKYNKTKLGWACFESVRADLYNPKRQDANDKVRVSIAFLDWKHRHKSNDYVFERSTMDDTCPECMKELLEQILEHKEPQGKEFLRGHLIHLAHTRVPVNKRTSMEVEKSMTTQKEDAASIVGEELANELEEKAKAITKSEALVIKSSEAPSIVEEAKTDKEKMKEDEKEEEEKPSKKETKKAEVIDESVAQPDWRSIFKEVFAETQKPSEAPSHPLDTVLNEFKAEYDLVSKSDTTLEDKLTKLQGHYQRFVDAVREGLTPAQTPEIAQATAMEKTLSHVVSAMDAVAQRMELVAARLSAPQPTQALPSPTPTTPVQRSMTPSQFASMYPPVPKTTSLTPTIRSIVERNV